MANRPRPRFSPGCGPTSAELAYYLDTSACMKLVVVEAESTAMRRWSRRHTGTLFSSDLLRVEAIRTARQISEPAVKGVEMIVDTLPLVGLDAEVCGRAAAMDPLALRSLDALHLASAMTYADELDGIVTYDRRLADAAEHHGVMVIEPS